MPRQKLDRATIRELFDAAIRAPAAIHEEPWKFLVVRGETPLRRR